MRHARTTTFAFGTGVHLLIGAPLARMEAAIALPGEATDLLPDLGWRREAG
ncbi:hypothetical protein [Streptomyces sp. NBC_01481]|uniref:hypothetical protein n=1 Tax=Streptomyces sp. NBC_01481 TaxID=2975869 RepID=UPI00224E74D4|nr:hypothetical protein [Streptomyces sp. NBC_01481]MCX4588056.1 hypothetical protein [Streptomyces sp. NBC_01481]